MSGVHLMPHFVLAAAIALVAGAADAGPCEKNYSAAGVPLVTGLTFKSHQDFAGLAADKALERMARMVKSEGFSGIKVNRKAGTIDAWQETSGSGRAQRLKVTAKATDKGTRAAAVFRIQPGQLADDGVVRKGLCKIIGAADG